MAPARRLSRWLCCLGAALACEVAQAQETHAGDAGAAATQDAGVTPPAPPKLEPPRLQGAASLELPIGASVPAQGIEVLLSIDESGAVTDVALRTPLTGAVEAAVQTAARALTFHPALRDGQPLPVRIGFRFAAPPPPRTPPTASTSSAATVPPAAAPPQPPAEPPSTFGARGRVDRPPPGAQSRIQLRGEELRDIPGTFGEPLRVVATLPGVARSPFGLGFFVVRGAAFQNTGFFVDDYPVPLLYHLGAGPAIIASRLVDRLDFYAGGYPVNLGRYTAGVIGLHTAPPPTDRLQLELEIDALRASGLVVVPLPNKRGSVALALRRSYFELLLPLITDDVSLSYTDYQVRLDYKITDEVRASLFFFGSRDALETAQAPGGVSGGQGTNTGLSYAFDQLIAAVDWTPAPAFKLRWSGTVGPSRVKFANDRQNGDSIGTNTNALRLGERLETRIIESERFETRIGADLDVFLTNVRASAPSIAELPGIPSPGPPNTSIELQDRLIQLGFAGFAEQVLRLRPFEISVGMRGEYLRYGEVSAWLPEPRGVVRLQILPKFWLKAGTGLFSQAPLPFQVLRQAGNPNLRPNRALQSSVGAELELPIKLEIETSLFYNAMWQLTRPNAELYVDASGLLRPAFYADDARGRAYGWELLIRRRVSEGLFGWLSYTLSRSERFVPGKDPVVFNFDQTHVLNLAMSYSVSGFRFGARYTLATGRPVVNLLDPSGQGQIFDADQDDHDPSVRGGARTRLPTFHQLDLRIDRDFKLGPLDGSVYLDIINVYNAQNGEAYQYEYDFSRRGKLPGLPFLPTIGVRGVLR